MSTVKPPKNPEQNPRVKAVFDDIRATRNTEFVGNIWRYLAFDPGLLENVWLDVKSVMSESSHLDQKTKEMIYVAVSIANACSYCIHSHTAAAKAAGMSDDEHAELLRIVSLAAKTNHIMTSMQVPVDSAFDASA
ncbi:MAG: carboxymuconolactone decarboxylase family protein [Burkholderiaceae bacterium]